MKSTLILLTLILAWGNAQASQSMRKCMLLPVVDNLEGALAFKIFEGLESYIKESSWCYYRHNSDIVGILKNYKKDLHRHLQNSSVLKILAQKVKAGSLIKVVANKVPKGAEVEMQVIGANGEDVYFKEKTHMVTDDPVLITQQLIKWLEVYEKNIPYDGLLIGVLGDQFTVDIGKASNVKIGNQFKVVRMVRKKKHPLLKEVVSWDFEVLARGAIFNVSKFQAQGVVKVYEQRKKLRRGDWVSIERNKVNPIVIKEKYPDLSKEDFGQLGYVGIGGMVGSSSASNFVDSTNKKIGGLTFGVDLFGEVWATREYFVGVDIGRHFSSYSAKEGSLSSDGGSVSLGVFKLYGGYRWLPLGFFHGPQIDGYVGYAHYSYNLETSTADSFGESSFAGMLFGVKGSVPIVKQLRATINFVFQFSPEFEEDVVIFGEEDSTSGFEIEPGVSYQYSPKIGLHGGVELRQNKAKFNGDKELSLKSASLKFGASFNF